MSTLITIKKKKNLKIQEDAVLTTGKQNKGEVILQIPSSSSPISHGEVTNADKMKIR
jgi:hypothetical protein